MSSLPTPRPATELSAEQYAGRACCYCAAALTSGARPAGISHGRLGAHVLDIQVYACPNCCAAQASAASRTRSAAG